MKIAITRPREKADETIKRVENKGWKAVIIPGVEIIPRAEEEVKKEIGRLEEYHWLILTSASGAEIMLQYFGEELKKVKLAVIGPKTKKVLEEKGVNVDLVPKEYKGENLAEELISRGVDGTKILVARASIGREVLIERLRRHAEINEVVLYDVAQPRDIPDSKIMDGVDAVIFTSSQSVKNLYKAWGEEFGKLLKNKKICAIGPITAGTLRGLGVRVDVMPEEYTVDACLEALR
jgi:uroporphyrinogen III methyltransferase/synthase